MCHFRKLNEAGKYLHCRIFDSGKYEICTINIRTYTHTRKKHVFISSLYISAKIQHRNALFACFYCANILIKLFSSTGAGGANVLFEHALIYYVHMSDADLLVLKLLQSHTYVRRKSCFSFAFVSCLCIKCVYGYYSKS